MSDSGGHLGFADRVGRVKRQFLIKTGRLLSTAVGKILAAQSLVGNPPVFDPDLFPQVDLLEHNWTTIRDELDIVLKGREAIPPFQKISPDQDRIAKGDFWKTFIFYGFGFRIERNCARCPKTVELLERIPNLKTAWFSIISPKYHVPAHRGVTKGLVRIHLGLRIPKEREKCYMRVDKHKCVWEEGKCIVFDDTFEHEVHNDTDEERVVLLVDFDRPLKLPGRLLNRFFLSAIRRTAYVQDSLENIKSWEERFEVAARRADAMATSVDSQ